MYNKIDKNTTFIILRLLRKMLGLKYFMWFGKYCLVVVYISLCKPGNAWNTVFHHIKLIFKSIVEIV